MKKGIIFTGLAVLVFAACATAGGGETTTGGAAASRPGGARADGKTRQIPLETKSMVLFADGSLDEYTTTDYDSSFNITGQSRYSASGALLEQIEYIYQDEKGRLSARITRDAENRIKNRIVYEYDDQGHLLRETLLNKAGEAVSSSEYAYDGSGNCIARTVNSGTGAKLAGTIYTYNSDGTLASSETRNGAGQKISSTLNGYDARGNLINQKIMGMDGQVTTLIDAVWQDGHEIENEQKGPDGSIQLRVTNEYGAEGELLKKTVENVRDESIQIVRYEYAFKPAGR
ncbi:MAG: hypothetical protein LBP27_03300 [Treponema sp.]|jgi:membrane-bound inhibitor of C-type lysozyme|nr:hypothetical protein [Treponema sp.]